MAALTNNRHELFAIEYCIDMNASAAAVRAGFKDGPNARVIGHRLMQRRDVLDRINALMNERRDRCDVDAQFVIDQLRRAAESCLQLVPKHGPDGDVVALVPANATAGLKALELLGRHLAMFVDRNETISAEDAVIEIIWPEPGPVSKRDFEPAPESGVAVEN